MPTRTGDEAAFAFIEANPRLQVEHTVTEEVTGVDLVRRPARAGGRPVARAISASRQPAVPAPRGIAMQVRINMETMGADGAARPAGGTLATFEAPSGPGVRVDTFGYAGYRTSPRFDSLLAKLVVHSASGALRRRGGARPIARCASSGSTACRPTSPFLQSLLQHPDVLAGRVHDELRRGARRGAGRDAIAAAHRAALLRRRRPPARLAGARVDASDPLAVLVHGKQGPGAPRRRRGGDRSRAARAGRARQHRAHRGPHAGHHREHRGAPGRDRARGPGAAGDGSHEDGARHPRRGERHRARAHGVGGRHRLRGSSAGLRRGRARWPARRPRRPARSTWTTIRPDLAEVRRASCRDARRRAARRGGPAAEDRPAHGPREHRRPVRPRHRSSSTARWSSPPAAARHASTSSSSARRPTGWSWASGGSTGTCSPDKDARCVVMSYDYTVLAGTQGEKNHQKKDRMFELAEHWRLPVVFFTEGGGGRPGRHRPGLRRESAHAGLPPVRQAERPGAARGHHLRPVLRRQRRDARLLRRDHRHRELHHRHGRPGHDRGRRARRLPPGGGRADERPGAERRRRRRGGRRGRGRARGQAVSLVLPGAARPRGSAPTSGSCAGSCPRTGCASTTSAP